MTNMRKRKATKTKSGESNEIIKYTDFLIIAILLLVVFSFTAFMNKRIWIKSKNQSFLAKLPKKPKLSRNIQSYNKTNVSLRFPHSKPINGISACLLVKDENNNLPEWLAYHYHVLPLRYLIVAVDPNSMTSPTEILNRWNHRIKIIIWDDDWFLPKGKRGKLEWKDSKKSVSIHRYRQRYFYQNCIQHLHRNKATWTMLIDADEYLVINPVTQNDPKDLFQRIGNEDSYKAVHVPPRKHLQLKLKFGMKFMPKNAGTIFNEKLQARTRLPSIINQTTIEQVLHDKRNTKWTSYSCIILPRITFGNSEESNKTKLYENIPSSFHPLKFNTLRFFRYDYKGMEDKAMSPGKSLVDVSKLTHYALTRNMTLCMHAVYNECGHNTVMLEESVLKIHHYSMPKEIFFAKSDRKRNMDIYNERAVYNKSVCYFMKPWLESFVNDVGVGDALDLLKGSGEIGDWKHPEDTSNFVS